MEQVIGTDAAAGAHEADRHEVCIFKCLLKCRVELGLVELAVAHFKVLHREFVVDFDDLLDDGLVRLVH